MQSIYFIVISSVFLIGEHLTAIFISNEFFILILFPLAAEKIKFIV